MAKPKKKWGQNFLRNGGAVDRIAQAVEPRAAELVLEIGPGEGVLTEKLIALGRPVTAVEIDGELAEALRVRFAGQRVGIVEGDALETPLPPTAYRAVGNLPYNAGTPILRRVIADPNCKRAVFMLQKEVADRLLASPGDDDYGYLTLYVRVFSNPRLLLRLGPRSFYPPPKVHSAVVVLDPATRTFSSERDLLLDMISASFRMRRKTLANNLAGWRGYTRNFVAEGLEASGLDPAIRAEELGLEQLDQLCFRLTLSVPVG